MNFKKKSFSHKRKIHPLTCCNNLFSSLISQIISLSETSVASNVKLKTKTQQQSLHTFQMPTYALTLLITFSYHRRKIIKIRLRLLIPLRRIDLKTGYPSLTLISESPNIHYSS